MENTINTQAVWKAFNYEAAHDVVDPIISEYEGRRYTGDIVINDVEDSGNIIVTAGGYTEYGRWEIISEDEGYWLELKPVGELNADGKHTAYEVIGHAHI